MCMNSFSARQLKRKIKLNFLQIKNTRTDQKNPKNVIVYFFAPKNYPKYTFKNG